MIRLSLLCGLLLLAPLNAALAQTGDDIAQTTEKLQPFIKIYVYCTRWRAAELSLSNAVPDDVITAAFAGCSKEMDELGIAFTILTHGGRADQMQEQMKSDARKQLTLEILQMRAAAQNMSR